MALPFTITLIPPYILVSPTNSLNSLISADNISQWGYIEQLNVDTTGYAVGDVVYYDVADVSLFQDTTTSLFYGVLDETKILFIESAP